MPTQDKERRRMKGRSMTLAALAAFLVLAPGVAGAQVQRGERMESGTAGQAAPDSKSMTDPQGPTWGELVDAGNRAYRDGQYHAAETALRRAVEVAERTTPRDWRVVIALTNLGHVVRTQRRATEAEALYRQALEAAEELRGEDHPDLLDPLKNLGVFYYEQLWYAQAEAIFARLLRIATRSSSARDRGSPGRVRQHARRAGRAPGALWRGGAVPA